MLVVLSDQFAESEWCLGELRHAREAARPMVVVDAVARGMANPPTTLGRAPRFRYEGLESIERIVSALLLETLRQRCFHSVVHSRGLHDLTPLLAPDEFDLSALSPPGNIVYPDPPLPLKEVTRLERYGGGHRVRTLLEHLTGAYFPAAMSEGRFGPAGPLGGATIGLSISAVEEILAVKGNRGVTCAGLGQPHIDDLFCEIARLLVTLGGRIALGTDLRKGGFTDQLLDVLERYGRSAARQDLLVWFIPRWSRTRSLTQST
jgi:hypothetical protein